MARFRFVAFGVKPEEIPDILVVLRRSGFSDAVFRTTCTEEGLEAGEFIVDFRTDEITDFVDKLNALLEAFAGHKVKICATEPMVLRSAPAPRRG